MAINNSFTFPSAGSGTNLRIYGYAARSGRPITEGDRFDNTNLMTLTNSSGTYSFNWHVESGRIGYTITLQAVADADGTIHIDWGDGIIEDIEVTAGTYLLDHTYTADYSGGVTIYAQLEDNPPFTFAIASIPESTDWDVDEVQIVALVGGKELVLQPWTDVTQLSDPFVFDYDQDPLVAVQGRRVDGTTVVRTARSDWVAADTAKAVGDLEIYRRPARMYGSPLRPPVRVKFLDSYGRLLKTTANITLSSTSGATISGALTQKMVDGKVTFPNVTASSTDETVLSVTDGTLTKTVTIQSAGDSPASTPDEMVGVLGWYRSDDGVTDAGGGSISNVTNQITPGTNDQSQPNASYQPTIGSTVAGRPSIALAGGTSNEHFDHVLSTYIGGPAVRTFWLAGDILSVGGDIRIVDTTTAAGNGIFLRFDVFGGGFLESASGGSWTRVSDPLTTGLQYLVVQWLTSGSVVVRSNGADITYANAVTVQSETEGVGLGGRFSNSFGYSLEANVVDWGWAEEISAEDLTLLETYLADLTGV